MSGVAVIVGYALRESFRRKVFVVVLVLTLVFLGLYGWGCAEAFHDVDSFVGATDVPVDTHELAGGTLFGLSMFATLFLGAVLAVFLTLGVVRGDAERGLLQPLVVRPLGRTTLLVARFLAAAAVCSAYVALVYVSAMVITHAAGGWWPDRIVLPYLGLAGGVVLIAAVSLLGSVYLTVTANGIAIFMIVGAGLVAGLLGQVGEAIGSKTLEDVSTYASWALPFEALYQDALSAITADTSGLTRVVVELGPFGGAQDAGPLLWLWSLAYLVLIGAWASAAFARRDL
jgi:ABC-type transport system involved in multi-copper enzyme maturation permease subunit